MAALAPSLSSLHPSKPLLKPWRQSSSHFSAPLLFKDQNKQNSKLSYPLRLRVMAATEGSAKNPSKSKEEGDNGEDPSVPSWAKPGSDELPPWARQEAQKESSSFEVPFYVYLLASAITAIAAIGSVFEYVNQRPVFGVLNSDSVFYAPLLGFFAFTGIPSSMIIAIGVSISILVRFYGWDPLFQKAFLWFKSVQAANKEAEEQDRRDGYF